MQTEIRRIAMGHKVAHERFAAMRDAVAAHLRGLGCDVTHAKGSTGWTGWIDASGVPCSLAADVTGDALIYEREGCTPQRITTAAALLRVVAR
jgi:hypothetical protein